jgi:hypothetical protein
MRRAHLLRWQLLRAEGINLVDPTGMVETRGTADRSGDRPPEIARVRRDSPTRWAPASEREEARLEVNSFQKDFERYLTFV